MGPALPRTLELVCWRLRSEASEVGADDYAIPGYREV